MKHKPVSRARYFTTKLGDMNKKRYDWSMNISYRIQTPELDCLSMCMISILRTIRIYEYDLEET